MKYFIGAFLVVVLITSYFLNKSNKEDAERLKQAEVAHQQKIEQEKQAEIDKKEAIVQEEIARQKHANEAVKAQISIAEKKVRESLLDPNSAEFRNQKGNCGEVNAKNRMGGFTGYSRYIYEPNNKVAFIESTLKDALVTPEIMDDLWAKNCKS